MILTSEQKKMLRGEQGTTKQKAMRLLVDLGKAASARRLINVNSAHVSGVSPLTDLVLPQENEPIDIS